jgi:hypothetical protein
MRGHPELCRRRRLFDNFGKLALRERRVLRIEMPHVTRGTGGRIGSVDQRDLAEIALVVVAHPHPSVLRHPAAESVDIVGHSLRLRLQFVAIHAVQDQIEGADD